MAEVIEIIDCFVYTKSVMIEKKSIMNNKTNRFRSNYSPPEKAFKLILKKEDSELKCVRFDLHSNYDNHYKRDFVKLQRELELKKHDVFYDGDDINQVIQYYSTL